MTPFNGKFNYRLYLSHSKIPFAVGCQKLYHFLWVRVVILMVYLAPLVPFELAQICNVQEMTTQIYFFNNFVYFVCLGA